MGSTFSSEKQLENDGGGGGDKDLYEQGLQKTIDETADDKVTAGEGLSKSYFRGGYYDRRGYRRGHGVHRFGGPKGPHIIHPSYSRIYGGPGPYYIGYGYGRDITSGAIEKKGAVRTIAGFGFIGSVGNKVLDVDNESTVHVMLLKSDIYNTADWDMNTKTLRLSSKTTLQHGKSLVRLPGHVFYERD